MRTTHFRTKASVFIIALACILLVTPNFTSALDDGATDTENDTQMQEQTVPVDTTNKRTKPEAATPRDSREEKKEIARERLSATKLKVCTIQKEKITNIMERVIQRSQRHIDTITAISDRTKTFYEAKSYELDIYITLTDAVEVARVAAQAEVDGLSSESDFNCESDGPKSDIQDFRNQVLAKRDAIGAYRSAVKNLIVAVKSVQPAIEEGQQ